jgi:hypothetical protein
MKFLYPQFLFALFTVLIPVIIHLFNFQRYRKVSFSNVSFLKEVQHSTKAKSNLKHILILISRILAISALVFAFAQPFIPISEEVAENAGQRTSIFVDNSFSMEARTSDGTAFGIAREFGYKLAEEIPSVEKHQLLTNDFTGSEQRLISANEIIRKLPEVRIGSQSENLERIIKRQKSAFSDQTFTGFIISDFQKSQFDFSTLSRDSLSTFYLIPLEPISENNVSVDSVWFDRPVHQINQPEEIHFRVRNYGNEDQKNIRVTLVVNNQQESFTTLSVQANSFIDTFFVHVTTKPGLHQCKIELTDIPVTFDNEFFFNYSVLPQLNVVILHSTINPNFAARAFSLEPYFLVKEYHENSIDYSELENAQLVVLNEISNFSTGLVSSLQKFAENGGNIIIFPSPNENQTGLNVLLNNMQTGLLTSFINDSTRVSFIQLESPIYTGVFTELNSKINLPLIYKQFAVGKGSGENKTTLLQALDGNDFLSQWKVGSGNVFLFSSPQSPVFSNWAKHSLYLPTLYQIAFQSAGSSELFFTIGKESSLLLNRKVDSEGELFHIRNRMKNFDIIPEIIPEFNKIRLQFHEAITEAGNYELVLGDSLMSYVSFNYTRSESAPEYYSAQDLQTLIDDMGLTQFVVLDGELESFSEEYKKIQSGIELWKWCVILALLFLGIEVLLIRYFKPSVL